MMAVNIGRRGSDGRTAWELRHGRKFGRWLAECTEHVMYRDSDKKASRLDDRWHDGIYLGPCLNKNESYVGTKEGAIISVRSFKRLPPGQKASGALVKGLRGIPWRPGGDVEHEWAKLNVQLPVAVVPREQLPPPAMAEAIARNVYIRRSVELQKFGYTDGCAGCRAAKEGDARALPHSPECRARLVNLMRAEPALAGRVHDAEMRVLRASTMASGEQQQQRGPGEPMDLEVPAEGT
eukprot:5152045-Amphidinium_carterae.1